MPQVLAWQGRKVFFGVSNRDQPPDCPRSRRAIGWISPGGMA